MFCRYVINKINHRTNCYQGILVTLGTMKHRGELNALESIAVDSIFGVLNKNLPTPPDIENEVFRKSISWFKKDSTQFEIYTQQMILAAQVLKNKGYEILILETNQLHDFLYEDSDQVLINSGSVGFKINPVA